MSRVVNVKIVSNDNLIRVTLKRAKVQALRAIGATAERYAKQETPVDLGRLRNSMTHVVQDDSVYVGTNVEYAA